MELDVYQEMARETAIYPREYAVIYPALGLAGEVGEVANKVKKVLRDDFGVITAEKKKAIADEVGDVFWYVAALATDLGLKLHRGYLVLPKYLPSLSACSLYFDGKAGRIAEYAAGVEGSVTGGEREDITLRIEDNLIQLVSIAHAILYHLGVTVEEVLQRNIDKLFSRKERGTLQGSGDNR